MSTAADKAPSKRWPVTLALGTVASGAIWLAGAHDVAYLGYIITVMAREPLRVRSCRRRLVDRRCSS